MMTTDFEKALMHRDGLTPAQAASERQTASDMLQEYLADGDTEGAYEVLSDWGLEPDYIFDLL